MVVEATVVEPSLFNVAVAVVEVVDPAVVVDSVTVVVLPSEFTVSEVLEELPSAFVTDVSDARVEPVAS